MILADKIMILRKQKGWSQEDLANQLNVSRQSVSKWESNTAVPDMNKTIKLSNLFHVTTDYLLKDDADDHDIISHDNNEDIPTRHLSQEDVQAYLNMQNQRSKLIAFAVGLILVGVASLILFSAEDIMIFNHLSMHIHEIIGIVSFFVLLALAVIIFIIVGLNESDYQFITKTKIMLDKQTYTNISQLKNNYKKTYSLGIAVSIAMIILSVVPLMIGGISNASDATLISFVCIMFFMMAIFVGIIIRVSTIYASYDILLNQGDYNEHKKKEKYQTTEFSTIYWLVIVAAYLAYSFMTNHWALSWIILVVAGILYTAFIKIVYHIKNRHK